MNMQILPEHRRQIEHYKAVRARIAKPPRPLPLKGVPCPTLDFIDMVTGNRIIFLEDHNAHCITRYKFLIGETEIDRQAATDIINRVSKETGVTVAEMKGTRRLRRVADARQRAMAEVGAQCYWLSLPQIGRIFQKDHTTVLHAMRKYGVKRTNHKQKAA